MITDEQRQQYKLKGYDIVFERNSRVFAVNSTDVKNWNSDKQEKFCDATGLKLFTEEDGNPVFYDSDYFEVTTNEDSVTYLHYISTETENIPQPINYNDMLCLFEGCESLRSLDLSDWCMDNVISIAFMFNQCISLERLNVVNWNVSNVKNMRCAFSTCKALQSLDLECWNVHNVIDMVLLFEKCSSLSSLKISSWDVSNVQEMQYMFLKCKLLQYLDLYNWNTRSVHNMYDMFYGCKLLQKTYGMRADKLEEALKEGKWPQPIIQQNNQPSKIIF